MKRLKAVTFIEVLIAIVITGMILSSMLTGLNFAYKYARHNANKTMALNFAQALVEKIKDEGTEGYEEYSDEVNLYQSEGVNITAERTVAIVEDVDYDVVTVRVEWDWLGKDPKPYEEISTIIQK